MLIEDAKINSPVWKTFQEAEIPVGGGRPPWHHHRCRLLGWLPTGGVELLAVCDQGLLGPILKN